MTPSEVQCLVIRPVYSSELLPLNGSSLHNAKYAQAVARSAVSPANFREVIADVEHLEKCYQNRYVVHFFLLFDFSAIFSSLLIFMIVLLFKANVWTKALLKGSADKISKLKTAYKSELSNLIKFERSSLEKSSRLEALLDAERSWSIEKGASLERLHDTESMLA